jgi:hypothetical protein
MLPGPFRYRLRQSGTWQGPRSVMPGLDPGIHDESQKGKDFRKIFFVAARHGLPG